MRPGRASARMGHLASAAVLALVALLVSPTAARAQLPTPQTLEITPFFGVAFGDDTHGATTTFGAAVGYHWTDQIAFEGELGIVPDTRGNDSETDVGLLTISANGLYHFDTGTDYIPYATFGLGFGHASYDFPSDPDESNTELAFNLGGGVRKAINEKIGWRADFRYVNVNDANPNFWRVYGAITIKVR